MENDKKKNFKILTENIESIVFDKMEFFQVFFFNFSKL